MTNAIKKIEMNSYEGNTITRLPSGNEKETLVHLKQKYKDTVLLEIYQNNRILHSVLANRIKVSPSGLNAIIKKLSEVSEKPICVEKKGKFTYYALSEAGNGYVENVLFPTFAIGEKEKDDFRNIYQLSIAFKDRNQDGWTQKLRAIVNEGTTEDDEGYGFVKEMGYYYTHGEEKAQRLLKLIVPDKEYYQPIIEYLNECNRIEVRAIEYVLKKKLQCLFYITKMIKN